MKTGSCDATVTRVVNRGDKLKKPKQRQSDEPVSQSLTMEVSLQLKPAAARVYVDEAPAGCESQYHRIFTTDCVTFVSDLVCEFDAQVDELHRRRIQRKLELDSSDSLPDFPECTRHIRDDLSWKVDKAFPRLSCRKVDCGDVSPSNIEHLTAALNSSANGVQVDFDDGHCPTWRNQIIGWSNVADVVLNRVPGVPAVCEAPVLMLRPRAWNMVEQHFHVNGRQAPGALVDFGVLLFHVGRQLHSAGCGPYFYLSKLEAASEARLWNDIFVWAQDKMGIPRGSIRACVLIENILASFEMEEILYELRHHSIGLNCGIWDYCASFINKFGSRPSFVLPDRNKYVNMGRHFLKSYMQKVIDVCHKRGAHATSGMHARVLPVGDDKTGEEITQLVISDKLKEIQAGVDGFLIYDTRLVPAVMDTFNRIVSADNQLLKRTDSIGITATDLLAVPSGFITRQGLEHNAAVSILFIAAWLEGRGHFVYKGCVEDSATAEISRSQVWQWLRLGSRLENGGEVITKALIMSIVKDFLETATRDKALGFSSRQASKRLITAAQVFMAIVTKREFTEFITTFLSLEHCWTKVHSRL